jgi:hypothetical protein
VGFKLKGGFFWFEGLDMREGSIKDFPYMAKVSLTIPGVSLVRLIG